MSSIDLSPFYRNSIGYDRIGALIDNAMHGTDSAVGYPPYNIEVIDEDLYAITLAIAGFQRDNLDITVESGVLTIRGHKSDDARERNYLHQGIANRAFERRFNLAEYVEVTDAQLSDGMLTVKLQREIPEAMKPRTIAVGDGSGTVLEHDQPTTTKQGKSKRAA